MLRSLLVIFGPQKGERLPISDRFTAILGRSKHANTQINDPAVSRVHCEIEIRGDRICLTDLDSASGTFVNGKRVEECTLRLGDVVLIGNTQLRVEPPEAAPPPPAKAPDRPMIASADGLADLVGHHLSHFELKKVIARGKTGIVFQAHDFKNDRPVAMKVLGPEFSRNEDDVQRFVRAMKTMLPLRHPNLVALLGAGRTGPYCWVAMELVEGQSLTQLLTRHGPSAPIAWKPAVGIALALARALDFAHAKNIVHRNVTPDNVLVGKTADQTKLGDLMLAKAQDGSEAQQITRPGEVLGDLKYMAPERTEGGDIDGRADLYSLGTLLYAMLTGRAPFEGNNVVELVTKIRQSPPTPPRQFQSTVPPGVEAIVLRLLAKSPEDRPASAGKLIGELETQLKVR
jgi:serine/threonine protein kinase